MGAYAEDWFRRWSKALPPRQRLQVEAFADRMKANRKIEADCILPGLWMGSEPPQGMVLHDCGFRLLVLCAMEHQPSKSALPGLAVVRCPLDDSPSGPSAVEWELAKNAAAEVARSVRAGLPALVTCHMGINRSGLVTALAVARLLKCSGSRAIDVVRAGRPQALRNSAFVKALCGRIKQ